MEIHSGHRLRMRQRAWEEGLSSLAPHEVIELLLYYALPRQDVNDLAHALLDHFGGLSGLAEADECALERERDMGKRAACLLRAFFRAANAYAALPVEARCAILTRGQAVGYARRLFMDDVRAQLYLVLMTHGGEVAYTGRLYAGAHWFGDASRRLIAERALRYDAYFVVLIARRMLNFHSVPETDRRAVRELSGALSAIGVQVLDFLICGRARTVSLKWDAEMGAPGDAGLPEVAAAREAWLSEPCAVYELRGGDGAIPAEYFEG